VNAELSVGQIPEQLREAVSHGVLATPHAGMRDEDCVLLRATARFRRHL
jgi:hypothetical protein